MLPINMPYPPDQVTHILRTQAAVFANETFNVVTDGYLPVITYVKYTLAIVAEASAISGELALELMAKIYPKVLKAAERLAVEKKPTRKDLAIALNEYLSAIEMFVEAMADNHIANADDFISKLKQIKTMANNKLPADLRRTYIPGLEMRTRIYESALTFAKKKPQSLRQLVDRLDYLKNHELPGSGPEDISLEHFNRAVKLAVAPVAATDEIKLRAARLRFDGAINLERDEPDVNDSRIAAFALKTLAELSRDLGADHGFTERLTRLGWR